MGLNFQGKFILANLEMIRFRKVPKIAKFSFHDLTMAEIAVEPPNLAR